MTDIVLRVARNERYKAVYLKGCEDDPRLSWKAAGILWYLLSRPDGWKFNRSDLVNRHTDGEAAVKSGLRELRKHGYLRMERVKEDGGQFGRYQWRVAETPLTEAQWAKVVDRQDTPAGGNRPAGGPPAGGFPAADNRPHSSKKSNKSSSDEEHTHDLFGEELPDGRVDYPAAFEALWEIHPKGYKKGAFKHYRKAIRQKRATHGVMLQGLTRYVASLDDGFGGCALAKWIREDRWLEGPRRNGKDPAATAADDAERWDRLVGQALGEREGT